MADLTSIFSDVLNILSNVFSFGIENKGISIMIISSLVIGITVILNILNVMEKNKQKEKAAAAAMPKPRFRKRDKVLFYGRKMLRKVKSFSGPVHYGDLSARNRLKKKRDIINLARGLKSILKLQESENHPVLQVKEPPPAILEADWQDMQLPPELHIPNEVLYMLKSVRVFGHFEKPLFLELCRSVESKFVPAGASLFRRGQSDDSIYVVQSGRLKVYITEPSGEEFEVKQVTTGDSVHSLLSILDVLTGHLAPYKTVSARAAEDTVVLRLPATAFTNVFQRFPESMVRVVQMIMVRLQRVTFQTLHNYLGLTHELINKEDTSDKSLSIHQLSPRVSPSKRVSNISLATSSSSSEKVTRIIDYHDEEKIKELLIKGGDKYQSTTSDSENELRGRTSSYGSHPHKLVRRVTSFDLDGHGRMSMSPSDFEAAAGRARVLNLEDVPKDPEVKPLEKPKKLVTQTSEEAAPSSARSRKKSGENSYSDDEVLAMAQTDLTKLFGFEDESYLDGHLQLAHVDAGSCLTQEGDQDASLFFIVSGKLGMMQKIVNSTEERGVFKVNPGEFIGELAVLTGEPAFFTVKALVYSRVIVISKTSFYSIMRVKPEVVLKIGHFVVRKLSSFIRQTDFALDWMMIEAGKALYRQNNEGDSTYIVLNGRLRSVITLPNGKKELLGEFGRGEMVGVIEVLTQKERITTVHAIRDTELAMLPSGMLTLIKRKFPQVVTRLIEILGQKLVGQVKEKNVSNPLRAISQNMDVAGSHPNVDNLSTCAIIAASDNVPLSNFSQELTHSLSAIGSCLRLTSDYILKTLGGSALDSIHEFRLTSWLGLQEDFHRIVLYQADYKMTPWTQRCIRQADCILIVALADKDPKEVSQMEDQLENLSIRAQKELILLHREKDYCYQPPTRTAEWLNARGWCMTHHHIRCPRRMFSKKSPAKLRETYEKLFQNPPDRHSDFSRLARFLTGTSIGLVLGGGGARGASQIGIIRGLQEYGIPIDMVGGVSIGAFNGALYCEDLSWQKMEARAKNWSYVMTSFWQKLADLTYPFTAMFSGRGFNRTIKDVFGEKQIEDLWIPYFTITTDISVSQMRIHTSGSLWRYVRASMSVAVYLPPLCDPRDGHLLVDGAYCNNLPADIMKAMGAQTVIAVDVGSVDETNLTNYGDELSGWWLLWKRWNPWAETVKVPDMSDIQSRLAYVSCMKQKEELMKNDMCEYIRPPIDRFKTLSFNRFEEIRDVGYEHAQTVFSGWVKSGFLTELAKEVTEKQVTSTSKTPIKQKQIPTQFTDLAAMISRLEPVPARRVSFELPTPEPEAEMERQDMPITVSMPTVDEISFSESDEMPDLDDSESDTNVSNFPHNKLNLTPTSSD
ncbi:patatin-like phospholipase domain-containing protein 7 isoform X2 [Anneissia japonica]|uniref:patatin-like phospholipase domain-containing protein 7 isoform X2 n=1 Tax=Anneissia japonica TaxID=1529436 RepID=UPI0014259126|nr:patatin-like phospholipase domain-containing protein 7 isoform X2 [Anneissia japonica]